MPLLALDCEREHDLAQAQPGWLCIALNVLLVVALQTALGLVKVAADLTAEENPEVIGLLILSAEILHRQSLASENPPELLVAVRPDLHLDRLHLLAEELIRHSDVPFLCALADDHLIYHGVENPFTSFFELPLQLLTAEPE